MLFVHLRPRTERPVDWVPDETASRKRDNISGDESSELFQGGDAENGSSIHSGYGSGKTLSPLCREI